MSGITNDEVPVPTCPYCNIPMNFIVPLYYMGEGVDTFRCKDPGCKFEVYVTAKFKRPTDEVSTV